MTVTFATRHFRAEREADWARLEELLGKLEAKSPRRLSDEDLVDLPRLYRATLSSLSIARATSLDASLVGYLEALSTRAYFALYSAREPWLRQVKAFFTTLWPRSVRAIGPELLLAVALLVLSAVAAYHLVRTEPAWFSAMISPEMASGRDMNASAASLRESIYGAPTEGGLEIFATFLFTHNSQVSIMAFALGFLFGIPTIILAVQNGALAGAMFAAFVPHGLGWGFFAWLMIHGTTEIGAIALATAAGMHIGRAVAFPGERTRMAAAADAGTRGAIVMIGVILMLLVAGLLEGFARQLVTDDSARLAIGAMMLALWTVYFTFGGRRGAA
ncbi:stage II sporulation protein M [Sphingomonas sp. 2R-10]|uniref:stage II sporulation protein M n=1 Tax=Sphingomonas sp. 2R-10 TaxID=3045148 RepID=UPI000F7972EE|nr:stage II sporulation protein M [Sphingomonas sp. 2R-10]MDJ0277213.1 stage II sporulation protein M [Sphingomonas sp. 2R-10]